MGFANDAKDDALDALWADVGVGSKLQVRSGAAPSDASATGTLLGEATIAEEPDPGSGGSILVLDADVDVTITTAGNIGHVRITKADGTTGHLAYVEADLATEEVAVNDVVRVASLLMAFPDLA